MTDLIERLRESAKGWEIEAADEIERLRRRIAGRNYYIAKLEAVLEAAGVNCWTKSNGCGNASEDYAEDEAEAEDE